MLGISGDMLATMRVQVTALLPDTCQVQAASTASDGAGGWEETWATTVTVACRVDPVAGGRQLETVAEREAAATMRQLTVPWDTVIAVGNRVLYQGRTYEVRGLVDDHAWRVSRRAIISMITGA